MAQFNIENLGFGKRSFRVVASDGKSKIGEVTYFYDGKCWGARVDVNEKFRRKGHGSRLLLAGDDEASQRTPGGLRIFHDKNGFSYKRYTSQIGDDQIVDIQDGGTIIFKLKQFSKKI